MGWDPAEDAWLSGFADGEASFVLARHVRSSGTSILPRFAIKLRADDVPVLRVLQQRFGGRVTFSNPTKLCPNPQWGWVVQDRRTCWRLVGYFERFPLHGKKARDFDLWREGVRLSMAEGGKAHGLVAIADALQAGRVYDDAHEPPQVAQLRLVR